MTRVAIVTASDSGIGKTTALMLAERGFDIGVTWHSDEKGALETCREVEAQGQRAEAIHLDLSALPEGAKAIETLIARFGRLDVLVNNAGAMTKAPFLEMPFDDWRNIFTVDVDGAFLCSQIAARQMVKQGQGGRIINITSVHEHTPLPDASAYTAAKHALGGLTKSMAMELVKHNILVNAVAPGANLWPEVEDSIDLQERERILSTIPLQKNGSPDDIAGAVSFLLNAPYLTGVILPVDGGRSVHL